MVVAVVAAMARIDVVVFIFSVYIIVYLVCLSDYLSTKCCFVMRNRSNNYYYEEQKNNRINNVAGLLDIWNQFQW